MRSIQFGALLLSAVMIAGCASRGRATDAVPFYPTRPVDKVEIFYNAEFHAVVHDFGNATRNYMGMLGGLFGPMGAVMAAGASYAATTNSMKESSARSNEFTLSVKADSQFKDMNREFAQRLATELERHGKVVKLTEVNRLPSARLGQTEPPASPSEPVLRGRITSDGNTFPAADPTAPTSRTRKAAPVAGNGYSPTAGYAPLLLRVTTGFAASEVYAPYQPVVLVEYALIDEVNARYLSHATIRLPNDASAKGYDTWEQLKLDSGHARAQLEWRLMQTVDQVASRVLP